MSPERDGADEMRWWLVLENPQFGWPDDVIDAARAARDRQMQAIADAIRADAAVQPDPDPLPVTPVISHPEPPPPAPPAPVFHESILTVLAEAALIAAIILGINAALQLMVAW